MQGSDASLQDVIVDRPPLDVAIDTPPPPPPLSCEEAGTPLDASCLGETIPTGWDPVAWQTGNVDCPSDAGFYDVYPQVTNAQIPNGACSCSGCQVQSSWTCTVTLAGGGTCTTDKATSTTSFCTNITGHPTYDESVARSGNPTCTGGTEQGTQTATADPVSLCFPSSCSTDFCNIGKGFKLCVYNKNVSDGGCPDNVFKVPTVIGGVAVMQCDPCTACTLANADAGCGAGTVTAWGAPNCDGGVLGTSTTNGACADLGATNYSSLSWEAGTTPTAICAGGTNVTTGQVDLANKGTICCTQ